MRLKTALNHKDRVKQSLQSLHRQTISFKNTLDTHLEYKKEIFKSIDHCPVWVKEYCRGVSDILFDSFYHHLEFCSKLKDGSIVSHQRKSTRYYEKLGFSPKTICVGDIVESTGHYWIDTNKPFS